MSARLLRLATLRDEVARDRDEANLRYERLQNMILHEIIEEQNTIRKGWTQTSVNGCVSPAQLEAAPEVAREPDTSSTALDPERVAHVDRCGE